jgi:MOSC domain-containing protein YiiM
MFEGKLIAIYITPAAGQPMHAVQEVKAIPAAGLEDDRYTLKTGTYSDKPGPDRQVTLIEIEVIEALEREQGLHLDAAATRRNLVTRDVPLNHLVGKMFQVGDLRLRGIRLCEPCEHLAKLTQPEVLLALIHRGGLRAEILNQAVIQVGDVIKF